jgi:phosphoribosylamine--glycine ligase
VFTELEPALAYVRRRGAPIVIKADGLAAGKGVIVALTLSDAEQALRDMLGAHAFGDASARVVIEDFLDGEEASYIVISDGNGFVPMATSQDHKRRDEGDLGPNTGGMGAYSPAPVVTPAVERRIIDEVIGPTLAGMAAEGAPFTGVLYCGLMMTAKGPQVLEYNARFGDPETQAILVRLESDLVDALEACVDGRLSETELQWMDGASACVVASSSGYPGEYKTGLPIGGLISAAHMPGVEVFHSGTKQVEDQIVTNGGRVLGVTASGDSLEQALGRAYEAVAQIQFDGIYYRRDIGHRALKKSQ